MIRVFVIIVMLTGCAHTVPASFRGTCPYDFPVKGNADSYIYHIPESPHYYKTNAEICFDSAEAARRHGFMAPKG